MSQRGAGGSLGAAMPPVELQPHPSTPESVLRALRVRATRTAAGLLLLDYRLAGDVGRLVLPPATVPRFRGGLWQHTCFEAFVAADPAAGYLEFNLSPSGEWATYAFTGYRAGMTSLAAEPDPFILCETTVDGLRVMATIDLTRLPGTAGTLRAGLAAVLERDDGVREYWALGHAAPLPDFHHPDSFSQVLPA